MCGGEKRKRSFLQKVEGETTGARPRSASRSEVNLSGNALATRVARPSRPPLALACLMMSMPKNPMKSRRNAKDHRGARHEEGRQLSVRRHKKNDRTRLAVSCGEKRVRLSLVE